MLKELQFSKLLTVIDMIRSLFKLHNVIGLLPFFSKTDFDETFHVACACLPGGYGTSCRSGYSPIQKIGRLSLASINTG